MSRNRRRKISLAALDELHESTVSLFSAYKSFCWQFRELATILEHPPETIHPFERVVESWVRYASALVTYANNQNPTLLGFIAESSRLGIFSSTRNSFHKVVPWWGMKLRDVMNSCVEYAGSMEFTSSNFAKAEAALAPLAAEGHDNTLEITIVLTAKFIAEEHEPFFADVDRGLVDEYADAVTKLRTKDNSCRAADRIVKTADSIAITETSVNDRMVAVLHKVPESYSWSLRQWARELDCAAPTVATTPAWSTVMKVREMSKQERIARTTGLEGPTRAPR